MRRLGYCVATGALIALLVLVDVVVITLFVGCINQFSTHFLSEVMNGWWMFILMPLGFGVFGGVCYGNLNYEVSNEQ